MRLTNRSIKRRTSLLLTLLFLLIALLACEALDFQGKRPEEEFKPQPGQTITPEKETEQEIEKEDEGREEEEKMKKIKIKLAAAGDIMFHDAQLESAYQEETDSYDFTPFFKDVKDILSATDLTIANFETTTAGPEEGYKGYPVFNTPDVAVDAIKEAGVDVLTTVNNHSLDTDRDGLIRTVKTIQERGIDTVGTYAEKPDSRVLYKDVKGIKLAFIAYTDSTNGRGDQYPKEELDAMLNMMEKDKIKADIQEAQATKADFIIAYMHWGIEYAEEPSKGQIEFAEMMAEAGVDLILGSHPHVIQKSDIIESGGKQTFVIYSMGNFISNQRLESLGEGFEPTEDGIILLFDIEKDLERDETTIRAVEYIPTWVYRAQEGPKKFDYRILPIDQFLSDDSIDPAFKKRMERSRDATVSKMIDPVFGQE